MINANPIYDFHSATRKNPERYSKKIHKMVFFAEQLLAKKGIEYKANDPCHFEEFCKQHIKHIEGVWAGKPFILSFEQKWITHCILGIKEKDKTHKVWVRYFRECVIFVARKFGKTLFMAALELWFVLCDKEPAAACYSFASNAIQARRLFDNVKFFIDHDEYLKLWFKFKRADNKYFGMIKGTQNFFTYESGMPKGKTGTNPHLAVFDELHEITRKELYKAVLTGQGARLQPMAISISSAGTIRGSLYDDKIVEIDNICKMRTLPDDLRMFFAVFEIDADDDPDNPKCWIKANPGIPENRPSMAFLKKEHKHSQIDVTARPSFLAYNLNRPANNAITYIELDELKNARTEIKHEHYYDSYAFGGVDLSDTTDLTCATALIPIDVGCEKFIFFQRYFVASKFIDKNSERDKVIYRSFTATNSNDDATKQLLEVVEGNFIDKENVARWFQDLETKYQITFLKIGYDRARKNEYLKYALQTFDNEVVTKDADGLDVRDNGVMTDVAQGWITTSEPIKNIKKSFEKSLIFYDKTNAMFEFCVNNLRVYIDRNLNVTIDKAKSTGRIDGFASLIDSVVAMQRGKDTYLQIKKTRNVYQSGEKEFTGA